MRDHLGIFDTPANRRQIRLGLGIVALFGVALCVILPLRAVELPPVQPFVPTIDTGMLVCELIIAAILYAQAQVFRSKALNILASGYVFAALLLIPHALTFPGAFAPAGLLDAGVNSTAWLATFRRVAFPTAVLLYGLAKRAEPGRKSEGELPPAKVPTGLLAACALAVGAAILATIGHDFLPALFVDQRQAIWANLLVMNLVTIALAAAAGAALLRRGLSVLDMWLLVAMSGWLIQSVMNLPLHARFTLGWYGLFGIMLACDLVVMLALIGESTRLYARLALSTAARERERETRLMSMDAVAAAIAHEVGQPLAAISLNTSAGLEYLKAEPPQHDKAAQALRDTQDAGRRAFDVVKSVRAMFSKGMGVRSQVDLNDLTLETTWLLDREIRAHKVTLDLDFDPDLPPIEANRVQIQRILINLITNSLEALRQSRRRVRNIAIRTARTGGHNVLLEVTDSGIGIPADKLTQIFEPFITTKKTGTGLGLSLCRTIVEEHGGRLWATPGEAHGVTFHLQIPNSSEAAA